MYRRRQGRFEVLLAHPGGPYWSRKDNGAWTIPKGEIEPGEDAFGAAMREFEEETGFSPRGDFLPLKPVRLKSGKTVHAWAFEADWDPGALKSIAFALEWPPRSGMQQEFPELDRAEWFGLDIAKEKIQGGQIGFIEELEEMMKGKSF